MKKNALAALYEKDGTKKVLSSLISIVAGLLVGGIAVLIVGLFNEKISLSGAWDGIRIIFAGIFSTGRDAAGEPGQHAVPGHAPDHDGPFRGRGLQDGPL